jgi:type IV pilus assembly protein PilV
MIRTDLRKQSGFTLVEVLVSALILAIGLIGIVGLQIHGLRIGVVAENGKSAGSLANQLVESIRLNAVNAGSYTALTSTDCPPASPASQHLLDYCSVYDTVTSRYRSHSANEAVAVSCLNCPNPVPQYQVTVSWAEMHQTGTSGDNTYVVGFVLPNG